MHNKAIIFEQPLNERLRFFLRLEFLFQRARHTMYGETIWDSHTTLTTLIEILNILGRMDVKTEVLKELDRISDTLNAIPRTQDVNHSTLDQILNTLSSFKSQLYSMEGSLTQKLKENEFLTVVIQRGGIAGGLCDFDLPVYNHWLSRDSDSRIKDLKYWFGTLDNLRLSIDLILKLIRESAESSDEVALHGNYQKTLDPDTSYQMIRIMLPGDTPYFAEISAGKHRFTARFMEIQNSDKPKQTADDVNFRLSCCAL